MGKITDDQVEAALVAYREAMGIPVIISTTEKRAMRAALSASDALTAGEREPVAVVVGHHVTQGPNVEFLTDNLAVGTKLYVSPASDLEALRKERDELRKYLSAAANDYTSLIDYLERAYTETDQPLPFEEAFSEAAAECRETSEFLRMAAEGKDVSAIYVDELTKAKEDHRAASEALATLETEVSRLTALLDEAKVVALEDAWLVVNGPDGECAKVVIGLANLKREVVATVFSDADDDSEEAQDMRDRLDDPDNWDGDRWSISWSFEDGFLNVQRISDLTTLAATPPAPVQDTWFTDRSLPVMAMSGDAEDNRVLRLHFRRQVTDDDRKAMCDALNLHQASLTTPPAPKVMETGLLSELSKHGNWQLDWGSLDPDDETSECGWRVHSIDGGHNDRQWTLIGVGDTPEAALTTALSGDASKAREAGE